MNPIQTFTGEPIFAGLFAFWSALADPHGGALFRTATRFTKHWNDVEPEQCPALFQMQGDQTPQYRKGLPTIWRCSITLFMYVHTSAQQTDGNPAPSQLMNPLIDAVRNAMVIDDFVNNSCTLGGLVSHCAIEGPIQVFEGDLGDDAVALIPVTFLVSP